MRCAPFLMGMLIASIALRPGSPVIAQQLRPTPTTSPQGLPLLAQSESEHTLRDTQQRVPSSVAVDDRDTLYVIDALHNLIRNFDCPGTTVGSIGVGPAQFLSPFYAAL